MLETYTISSLGVPLVTDQSVVFNVDSEDTDCRINHAAGTATVEINKPGYYLVKFNSTGYNTGAASTVDSSDGTYSFQLFNNSVAVPNAQARATSTASTAIANVGFNTIIRVRPSCCAIDNNANLEVKFLGQEGMLLDATLIILKVA
jgi:hypothetical protein